MQVYVFRTADVAGVALELTGRGFTLVPEQHGAGPAHFSTQIGKALVEIYPATGDRPCDRCAGNVSEDRPATVCRKCLEDLLRLPKEPDMARVLACAREIIARVDRHGVSSDAIAEKIDEVLFSRRDVWAAAHMGLITEEEAATVLLAHLATLLQNACGTTFHSEATESADVLAMRHALFGD